MATITIPWDDGSGDNIYLTYQSASGDQIIQVSSDANTGYTERTRDITFTATAGNTTISRVLTVVQEGKDIVIITRNDVAMTENDVAVGYEQ